MVDFEHISSSCGFHCVRRAGLREKKDYCLFRLISQRSVVQISLDQNAFSFKTSRHAAIQFAVSAFALESIVMTSAPICFSKAVPSVLPADAGTKAPAHGLRTTQVKRENVQKPE
jgi:hypothetical protein